MILNAWQICLLMQLSYIILKYSYFQQFLLINFPKKYESIFVTEIKIKATIFI